MKDKIAIFGTSGFAREVADICLDCGFSNIIFLGKETDSLTKVYGKIVAEDEAASLNADGYVFAIGIGNPQIRKKILERYDALQFPNLIHPSATFGCHQKKIMEKSDGNIIAAGVRFTNNIQLGNASIFNLNVTIGHDCIIRDYVSIMPGANISGNVCLDDEIYIGTGASVINGDIDRKLTIGKSSIVGAGAVVTKDIEPNVTVVGVPAKVIGNH